MFTWSITYSLPLSFLLSCALSLSFCLSPPSPFPPSLSLPPSLPPLPLSSQTGLSGQSLILVYHPPSSPDFSGTRRDKPLEKFVLITGNEAVSKSLTISINTAASKCEGFLRTLPVNKDDESRIHAIEKELITKLGSNVSACVQLTKTFLVSLFFCH